jgi:UDP-glucose 4-epimerase
MSFTIGKQLKFGWPDSIIHLASHANQAAVDTDQYGAINSMLGNVFNTMEMAKNFNSKYIFVSSSMAYGNFTQNPQPESALLSPVNLYGLLKKQGEELVHQLDGQSVIVRPSAVYGPGDNQKRVLGKWINAALNNEVIIVNDPGSLLDFTYVKDTAMGIMLAEEHGHIGKTYNITRGQARSLSEAAFLIKYMLASQSQIEYKKSKSTNTPQRGALDISAAQDDLGYAPKFDLTDGLEEYINWMRKYRHIYE